MSPAPASAPVSPNGVNLTWFSQFSPLSHLRPETRRDIANVSRVMRLEANDVLLQAGQPRPQIPFLLEGEVDLVDPEGPSERVSAGHAGRAANPLVDASPSPVTVRAIKACKILMVDAAAVESGLAWDQAGQLVVEEVGAQTVNTDWMVRLLTLPVFHHVPATNLQAMFLRLEDRRVAEGEVIVRQGDEGDFFYVLRDGTAIVTREMVNGVAPVKLATLEAGAVFGEEALISDERRNATVTMATAGRVMRLSKQDFRTLLKAPLVRKVPYDQAHAEVQADQAQWLDVRLASEYQNKHLKGALNIPLFMLRQRQAQLDPTRTYAVYCNSGSRSEVAVFLLLERGYSAYVVSF